MIKEAMRRDAEKVASSWMRNWIASNAKRGLAEPMAEDAAKVLARLGKYPGIPISKKLRDFGTK